MKKKNWADWLGRQIRLVFCTDDQKLYRNESFRNEWLRQEVFYFLWVAVLVSMLSLIGLVGTSSVQAEGEILPWFNAPKVYALILGVNIVFFSLLLKDREEFETRKNHAFFTVRVFSIVEMLLANITFFTTQKGSSFFFEYLLISMVTFLVPLYAHREMLIIMAADLAPAVFITLRFRSMTPWQDLVDLMIFQVFRIFVASIRWYSFVQYEAIRQQLEQSNSRLQDESRTDGLTGLLNRNAWRNDFTEYLNHPICLALVDLDYFKHINDTYGHLFGDKVLVLMAELVRKEFSRDRENCYRFGGDELLILSVSSDAEEFEQRLRTVQKEAAHNMSLGIQMNMSIGFCSGLPRSEEDLRLCMKIADHCLYAVKGSGRNSVSGGKLENAEEYQVNGKRGKDFLASMMSLDEVLQSFHEPDVHAYGWTTLYFDINHFADLSNRLGFKAGRAILQSVAMAISNQFPGDLLANPELDHFVLYTVASDEEILKRVELIRKEIAGLNPDTYLSLKCGAYRNRENEDQAGPMQGLYNAKYAAENSANSEEVVFYDAAMDRVRRKETYVQDHFIEALEQKKISVFYQPIVSALSEKTVGFEALSRWKVPEEGILSPADFIPCLERTHLIFHLDLYLLEQVCLELDQKAGDFFVNVNLSQDDFDVIDVPDEIEHILAKHRIAKEQIQFEITESAVGRKSSMVQAINEMQSRGFRIWIDDFGTGQSSLSVLKDYSVSGIKLDQEFLRGSGSMDRSKKIISEIVILSHSMGFHVIAEGIETSDQYWFVRRAGVDLIQGFYFSKPIPFSQLSEGLFFRNLTSEEDRKFYRAASWVDLDGPMESCLFRQGQEHPLFAKGVLEQERGRLYFLRMNEDMEKLCAPVLVRNKNRMEIDQEWAFQAEVQSSIAQLHGLAGVVQFQASENEITYFGEIGLLASSPSAGKEAFVLTITNYHTRQAEGIEKT
ncbi:MAG: EAL domain-containing protein [Solobacterium sp.]|jgi:diguanylate cyclase (GGDEF)-like protein|nr:EAL domain-containing protein [Solobacterium sp.]